MKNLIPTQPENNGTSSGRDDRGRFSPGNPGKPPGSTRNKMRAEIREFLNDQWPSFRDWFAGQKESEKIKIFLELLPYNLPKLSTITATGPDGEERDLIPNFGNLSPEDFALLVEIRNKTLQN